MDLNGIVSTIITNLPNFAIAVWCIYNYQRTIDKLLDQQNKLLDQLLLKAVNEQAQQVEAKRASQ